MVGRGSRTGAGGTGGIRVDHITAVVTDVSAAEAVLARLLGQDAVARLSLPGMAIRTFQLGEVQLHVNAPDGPGPVADFHAAHGTGLHHLALQVPDLDTALCDLRALGFATLGAPTCTAPGLREVFLDPRGTAGLLLQLVERRVAATETEGHPDEALDGAAVAELAAQLGQRDPGAA